MSSLSDYRTFTLVVENLSITKTANQLHRSISAVSKQLTKLENALGVQLIDRSTHSFAVTELGARFYERCVAILAAVDDAERDLNEELSTPAGKITLSFPEVLLSTRFMALVKSFCLLHPEIKFNFRLSNAVDDIIGQDIDFAFRIGKLSDSRLTAIALHRLHFVFCASPDYIQRHGVPSRFQDVLSTNQVLLPTYVNMADFLKRYLPRSNYAPFNLDRAHTFTNEATLHQAVLQGLGIAMLLDIAVADDLANGRLAELFPGKSPSQQIYLVHNKRHYMPQKMRLFKDYVKKHFSIFLEQVQ